VFVDISTWYYITHTTGDFFQPLSSSVQLQQVACNYIILHGWPPKTSFFRIPLSEAGPHSAPRRSCTATELNRDPISTGSHLNTHFLRFTARRPALLLRIDPQDCPAGNVDKRAHEAQSGEAREKIRIWRIGGGPLIPAQVCTQSTTVNNGKDDANHMTIKTSPWAPTTRALPCGIWPRQFGAWRPGPRTGTVLGGINVHAYNALPP
jgi:hypothetical protein